MKKSYHSTIVPIADAKATRTRTRSDTGTAASACICATLISASRLFPPVDLFSFRGVEAAVGPYQSIIFLRGQVRGSATPAKQKAADRSAALLRYVSPFTPSRAP